MKKMVLFTYRPEIGKYIMTISVCFLGDIWRYVRVS